MKKITQNGCMNIHKGYDTVLLVAKISTPFISQGEMFFCQGAWKYQASEALRLRIMIRANWPWQVWISWERLMLYDMLFTNTECAPKKQIAITCQHYSYIYSVVMCKLQSASNLRNLMYYIILYSILTVALVKLQLTGTQNI